MNVPAGMKLGLAMSEYRAVDALSISCLKQLGKSPRHYQWALANPTESRAMRLGTAAHCAVLEPERFLRDYIQWDRRTESGKAAPRNGKAWEAFQAEHADREIITADEYDTARAIAKSVRNDPVTYQYLATGEPEVGMIWVNEGGRACKGRMDWLTKVDCDPVIVGLKTARDARPYPFGAAAARLGYALQWAWYFDGYVSLTGAKPRMIEIVVESSPPHAVVTYVIPEDVLEYGRDEYKQLLVRLEECERHEDWHDIATTEQVLSLPSWVYGSEDDLTDLGLEAA